MDWELSAVPSSSAPAVTADLAVILFTPDRYRITEEYLVKPREDWPSTSELRRNRFHLGVKNGHYPLLLVLILARKMITFCHKGPEVIKNFDFGGMEGGQRESEIDLSRQQSQPPFSE